MSELATEPRIAVIIRRTVWLGMVAHAAFVPLFWLSGQATLALFNLIASVPLWILAWAVNRRGRSTLAMWLLVAEVASHALLAVALLGSRSGFQYYLIPLIPFMMFNDRVRTGTVIAGSLAALAGFVVLQAVSRSGAELPPLLAGLAVGNLVVPFVMLGFQSLCFRLASSDVERAMTAMALTDALTGLSNRRQMDQRLEEAVAHYRRQGSEFSVILADIDHFKRVNDRLGHDTGDRLLTRVAALFNEELRAGDVLARWGGEEFLVLLPSTGLEDALEVAARLRTAAEARLAASVSLDRPVTVTLGVAAFSACSSLESCLKAADDALYLGKAQGRNRVVPAATRTGDGEAFNARPTDRLAHATAEHERPDP